MSILEKYLPKSSGSGQIKGNSTASSKTAESASSKTAESTAQKSGSILSKYLPGATGGQGKTSSLSPKTYEEAVALLTSNGVKSASGIMTAGEWSRYSGKKEKTYADYLANATMGLSSTKTPNAQVWVDRYNGLVDEYNAFNKEWKTEGADDFFQKRSEILSQAQGVRNLFADDEEALSTIDQIVYSASRLGLKDAEEFHKEFPSLDAYKAALELAKDPQKAQAAAAANLDETGKAYREAKARRELATDNLSKGIIDQERYDEAVSAEAEARNAFVAAGGNPDASLIGNAARQYAGSLVTAFGTLSAANGGDLAELPQDIEGQRALYKQSLANLNGENKTINKIISTGNDWQVKGAENIESVKAGRTAAGKLLVDLAVQAEMMALDAALGKVTGGGLAPLAARAYGGAASEAMSEGANYSEASLYGAANAATEYLTEKMFDGFAMVYGKGEASNLVSYVSGKLAKSDAGRLAWQRIINGMGEGIEEVVSDLFNPLAKTIYKGKEAFTDAYNVGDMAYDFLVGAILGFMGETVEAVKNPGMNDVSRFFADAARNGMSFKEACKLYEPLLSSWYQQTQGMTPESRYHRYSDIWQEWNARPETIYEEVHVSGDDVRIVGEEGNSEVPYNALPSGSEATYNALPSGTRETRTEADPETPQTVQPEQTAERPYQEAQEAPQTAQEATQEEGSINTPPQEETPAEDSTERRRAIAAAESYGESGIPFTLLVDENGGTKLESVQSLTPQEREDAYLRGKKKSAAKAEKSLSERENENNGANALRRGRVYGDGISARDIRDTFNDRQGEAYAFLQSFSELTGIDIILYRSEAKNGVFDSPYQGKFKKSTDQIYVDLNSGLIRSMDAAQLQKYVAMRTFGHEFTHFVEKWSPVQYNQLREAVFAHATAKGVDVDAEIRANMDGGRNYDAASREVMADAMADALPDSQFAKKLAEDNPSLFRKFLDKFKEFVQKLKEHFAKLVKSGSKVNQAMQENVGGTVRYAENIIRQYDEAAYDAVKRYQRARGNQKPVSINDLAVKAEAYAEDEAGKQQLSQLIEDAFTRGRERNRLSLDELLSKVDTVESDTGREELAGLFASAYARGQSETTQDDPAVQELYKHFFEGETPEEAMDALKKVGFSRWQKNGKDRLYINADSLGLEITWGKRMGQVESASFQGEDISKRYASELRSAKTYVDVKTQEVIGTDSKLKEIATNLYMETLTKAYENAVAEITGAKAEPVQTEAANATEQNEAQEEAPQSGKTENTTVEEAKAELKKSIKVPIQTTNQKALMYAIETKQLSFDTVTLGAPPAGFNKTQQTALVRSLIEGVYTDKQSIKVDVPYDGQFSVENTPGNVVKILDRLRAKANQEVTLTKDVLDFLKNAMSKIFEFDGSRYITQGHYAVRIKDAAVEYATKPKYEGGYDVGTFEMKRPPEVSKRVLAEPPKLWSYTNGATSLNAYEFSHGGEKVYFNKHFVDTLDKGTMYLAPFQGATALLTYDADGLYGFALPLNPEYITLIQQSPIKLKAFKPNAPAYGALEKQTGGQSASDVKVTDAADLINAVKGAQATANETGEPQTVKISEVAKPAEEAAPAALTPSKVYKNGTVTVNVFNSQAEYDAYSEEAEWDDPIYQYNNLTIINDVEAGRYRADGFFPHKSYKIAVKKFLKQLVGYPGFEDWTDPEGILEAISNGTWKMAEPGAFSWGVETNTDDENGNPVWYIYLNVNHAVTTGAVETPNNNNVEANNNGKNEDQPERVQPPEPDGKGTSRLVDEREAEDVQGTGRQRGTAGLDKEPGQAVRQSSEHVHEAGASGIRGERAGESGLSELNPAELEERDRQQKSTVEPGGSNFIIGESLNLPKGEKGKYKANIQALRLAYQIQSEGRFATAEEQEVLSKYVGWGGLSKAFGRLVDGYNRNSREGYAPDSGWEKELDELWSLVDDGIITASELRSMANSSTNAHYTSIEVVKAMWEGLQMLGFRGGRLMEPSCGTGNFVGGMPAEMLPGVRSWTMVELDRVTGGIAKLLYPHADMKIQGFQDAKIPDNMLDLVIGNVPFGKSDFVDKRYPKDVTGSLHDYFFIKSLDKVRPGGIVMMLTSMYTMDKQSTKVRDYIAARADLLGAVRLPNTAFIENAATSVVTDMLILRKRAPGKPYGGEAFALTTNSQTQTGTRNYGYDYDFYLNEYFASHPEMILGTPAKGKMYGGEEEITYNPLKDGRSLRQQIVDAISTIPYKMYYPEGVSTEKTNVRVETEEKKSGLYQVKDGELVRRDGEAVALSDTDRAKMTGIVSIRTAYQSLVAALNNGYPPEVVNDARKALNSAYDSFVSQYGYINSQANKKLIEDEPFRFQLLALEVDYDKGSVKNKVPPSAKKADIFTKDTISSNVTVKSVSTIEEGIIASINVSGRVDPAYIGKLMGKSGEDVAEMLDKSEEVFRDEDGNFQYKEKYLSGNVRAKLENARYLAENDSRYEKNVRALEAVMPEDIPSPRVQANVNIGARWIDPEYYDAFLRRKGRLNGSVTLNAEGYYDVSGKVTGLWAEENAIKRKNGGTRTNWDAASIFEKILNGRPLVVYDTVVDDDGSEKRVVNKDDTNAAERIAANMRDEFREWLFEGKERATALTETFNEQFNSYVTPKYDGSKLTIKGLSPSITLRPHQKNAVQRMLMSGGNTLLAHCVGAGKTAVVASTVMKLREVGAIKRPLIICPKSLVAQWGTEFHKFFPVANILVADEKNFSPEKRAIFAANIQNGDYDAIIMSYQNFSEIPISEAWLEEFKESLTSREIQSQIDASISKGKGGLSAKKTASAEASLKKQINSLMSLSKNALIPTFEEFGFDGIFVDEAHNFKNLWYKTHLDNVGGLGSGETKAAMDLYAKISYLQKLNGGRGVALVTATPVMNSIVEMYTMQRYLQGDLLKQLGITTFDAWAGMFGVTEKVYELNAAGNYKQKTVMAKYTNLQALMQLYGQIADTVTKIDAKIPERVDELVEVPMSHAQREYMADIARRSEAKENPLKLTGDGRKMAYTIHMVDETQGYEPGCKIYVAADKIADVYRKSTGLTVNDEDGNPVKVNGTQIVFIDMGIPRAKKSEDSADASEDFSEEEAENATLYEAMKRRLVENGIPENEIAFIHDAKNDKQKEKLRDRMNAGTVRILIGSTGKMGVGMNAQRLCVALHNIDCPWRPGDLEQRNGRAIRQGNLFDKVEIFEYATVGSFDSAMWSKVDRKAKMIRQVADGDFVGDSVEADEGDSLSYAQIAAISSGDPRILQLLNVQKQVEGYESAYRYFLKTRNSYLEEAETANKTVRQEKEFLEVLNNAKETAAKNPNLGDNFSMTVNGREYAKSKDANKAISALLESKSRTYGTTVEVGTFCGLPITASKIETGHGKDWEVSFGGITSAFASDTSDWARVFSNAVRSIDTVIARTNESIAKFTEIAEERTELAKKPFQGREEWDAAKQEMLSLQEELGMLDSSTAVGDEEEDEQYARRTSEYTDRDILEMATDLSSPEFSEGQKDALRIFHERLTKLQELTEQRNELGRKYKEQQFGKANRDEAPKTLERMHILDSQIAKANDELLKAEQTPILRETLAATKRTIERQDAQKTKAKLDELRAKNREKERLGRYRKQVEGNAQDIIKWLTHPDNKNVYRHVPVSIRQSVVEFMQTIDFSSKRSLKGGEPTKKDLRYRKALNELRNAVSPDISSEELYSAFDVSPVFYEMLEALEAAADAYAESGEVFTVSRMNADQLKALNELLVNLKQIIMSANRLHQNAVFSHVDEAAVSTAEYISSMQSNNAGGAYKADEFLNWDIVRPTRVFKRFGKGGESILQELIAGQNKLAYNAQKIVDFAEAAFTGEEYAEWTAQRSTVTLGGEEVTMTGSQLMCLYELYKDPDGKRKLLTGGLRIATYEDSAKTRLGIRRKVSVPDSGRDGITEAELEAAFEDENLSPRQKEVADRIQRFIAKEGGEWLDEVSLIRFGEVMAVVGEHYFPNSQDPTMLGMNEDGSRRFTSPYALLNRGFTKQRKEANTRLILYDIFDVFTDHTSQVAEYNAFAIPVLDTLKWLNYKETDSRGRVIFSLKEAMNRAYGQPSSDANGVAVQFINGLLTSINGAAQNAMDFDAVYNKLLHRANKVKVAFNGRVIIQQPLSIIRAGEYLSAKQIARGVAELKANRTKYKADLDEMLAHSGIAVWKVSLGYYDTNISRGVEAQVKRDPTLTEKIDEIGMKGAEAADTITWVAMWNACKAAVERTDDDAKYWTDVENLFNYVIYDTQVVDSVLTKPAFMRSHATVNRTLSSFMGEPLAEYSMVQDAIYQFAADMRRDRKTAWAKNRKKLLTAFLVFGLSAIAESFATAIYDAWRDDDDYQTFLQKFREHFADNFKDNINILNDIPVVGTLLEGALYIAHETGAREDYAFKPSDFVTDTVDGFVSLVQAWQRTNKNYTAYRAIYYTLDTASDLSGVPGASVMREISDAWNNFVGLFYPDLKLKTYSADAEKEIFWAMQDGWIDEEQATQYLIRDAGYTLEDAAQQAEVWAVQLEYADYELTEAQAKGFVAVRDKGIAIDTYTDFRNAVKDMKGEDKDGDGKTDSGSKKEKVIEYIDALPLLPYQKDALFFDQDYAESTLEKTPWHK